MICPKCNGTGLKRVTESQWGNAALNIPCPECGGTGITSCCEGATPCDEVVKEQAGDEASRDN